jgi:hypothetical protein
MRRDLAIGDLGDLLERPMVAVLATHRSNGETLLSPVWHEWRDGGFNVVVGVDDAKRSTSAATRAPVWSYSIRSPRIVGSSSALARSC